LTGGRRSPSCSTSVALAENPPGTMPPVSGQCPVLASQHQSLPSRKNGCTNFTSIRCVPPRYGSLTMKTSPGWSAILSRFTRSITACTVNCIVPTNTGRPSSPCAISSPLSRW
jgi:hypothetical protein